MTQSPAKRKPKASKNNPKNGRLRPALASFASNGATSSTAAGGAGGPVAGSFMEAFRGEALEVKEEEGGCSKTLKGVLFDLDGFSLDLEPGFANFW